MREREVPDQGPGLDSVNELSPPPTEPHHDVRDERARDVAWNGWIDDHRDHGSVTRELMAAFDAGWAAAVSAADPDEQEALPIPADDDAVCPRCGCPTACPEGRMEALSVELADAREQAEMWLRLHYEATEMSREYQARAEGAEAAVAALAARLAPVVDAADVEITTAAELDALPAGTIVRDRFGGYLAQGRDAMGVAWFHYPVYDHAGSSALVAGIGPVTVCFTPGLTVADEGRAEA